MMRRTAWIVTCLFVAGTAGWVRADAVEEIQKKLSDSFSKLKSYSCKTRTVQNMEFGEGNKMQSDYAGTIEWSCRDDKIMMRTDMKGTSVQSFSGQENKSEVSTTIVCDGDMVYTLSSQMGQTMATKQKPDDSLGGDPKTYFTQILARQNVKVLPEDKFDGEACYVLEATPKDAAEAESIARTIMYFRKDIGINVKTIGLNKSGQEVFSNTSSDMKINSEIAADRFVFKAPEGVQVMDMTGAQPGGGE